MIDLHCHILPGVDDGASDLAEALEMARMAADSGVRTIVATPHCNIPNSPRANFLGRDLLNRFVAFRGAVEEAGIPLKIYGGAEVFCTPQMPQLLETQKLLPLAGTKYLLVEFFFDEAPEFMEDCFRRITALGFIPVIAHPERYEAVQREPALIPRWFRKGYIILLNKGTILGRLGRRAESTARLILEHGFAHAIASDAHGTQVRTPHMEQLRYHLESTYGPGCAQLLLSVNPARILKGQSVVDI